jgi:hypothetical protein
MLRYDDAERLARDHVARIEASIDIPLVLFDEFTEERTFGWVFFHGVDEKQTKERIAGNGPLIVDKHKGMTIPCGGNRPPRDFIESYERTGTVYGEIAT